MNSTKLEAGKIYQGVVSSTLPGNDTFAVRLDSLSIDITCVCAANILSGLFGFKTSYVPPQKTKVLVLYSAKNLSWVIGSLPTVAIDPNQHNRKVTGPDATSYTASQVFTSRNSKSATVAVSHKPPVDLVEGEIHIENMLGTALTLLRGMASISAGDLARVECHLLDDMVRILSDTFQHFTAFGNQRISNDGGKLNVVWHGTSNDFEAWGLPRVGDAKLPINPDKTVGMDNVDGVLDDGRWRFSQYIGWLGDFINLFITDPVTSLGKIAEGQFRGGKARMHVNNDGSIIVQSVADIVLEKVVRIPVPNPIRLENDPAGNRSDDTLKHTDYLKTWTPSDSNNLFEMVFQLRDYARWLNNTHSLGRFYQMDRDFQVPTEAQTPVPDLNSGELDKKSVNGGISNWRIAYSTIRIYRDGSYQQVDAYGNATTTTSTGYFVSTPRDLYLQAGGSINLVAGRDINLVAQKNIGLSAITQAVRIKGETSVMILANAGHLIMEVIGNFVTKIISTINVANTVEINKTGRIVSTGNILAGGSIGAAGDVVGNRITAALTEVLDDHGGHIFTGAAPIVVVPAVNTNFMFQTDYSPGVLYQTLSQQAMRNNEQPSAGSWGFSGNVVAGKGAPWPGTVAQEKVYSGGENLNTPSSTKEFTATPQAMTTAPITIKYQT